MSGVTLLLAVWNGRSSIAIVSRYNNCWQYGMVGVVLPLSPGVTLLMAVWNGRSSIAIVSRCNITVDSMEW